mmetsp:Transcript_3784/g.9216  ORF Transcript_3784/g.9216 Transcript_3784/m.9216 type:complete len:490 (-) Transcript_3784:28-1497(-)
MLASWLMVLEIQDSSQELSYVLQLDAASAGGGLAGAAGGLLTSFMLMSPGAPRRPIITSVNSISSPAGAAACGPLAILLGAAGAAGAPPPDVKTFAVDDPPAGVREPRPAPAADEDDPAAAAHLRRALSKRTPSGVGSARVSAKNAKVLATALRFRCSRFSEISRCRSSMIARGSSLASTPFACCNCLSTSVCSGAVPTADEPTLPVRADARRSALTREMAAAATARSSSKSASRSAAPARTTSRRTLSSSATACVAPFGPLDAEFRDGDFPGRRPPVADILDQALSSRSSHSTAMLSLCSSRPALAPILDFGGEFLIAVPVRRLTFPAGQCVFTPTLRDISAASSSQWSQCESSCRASVRHDAALALASANAEGGAGGADPMTTSSLLVPISSSSMTTAEVFRGAICFSSKRFRRALNGSCCSRRSIVEYGGLAWRQTVVGGEKQSNERYFFFQSIATQKNFQKKKAPSLLAFSFIKMDANELLSLKD